MDVVGLLNLTINISNSYWDTLRDDVEDDDDIEEKADDGREGDPDDDDLGDDLAGESPHSNGNPGAHPSGDAGGVPAGGVPAGGGDLAGDDVEESSRTNFKWP